jgi:hypothetical protein
MRGAKGRSTLPVRARWFRRYPNRAWATMATSMATAATTLIIVFLLEAFLLDWSMTFTPSPPENVIRVPA